VTLSLTPQIELFCRQRYSATTEVTDGWSYLLAWLNPGHCLAVRGSTAAPRSTRTRYCRDDDDGDDDTAGIPTVERPRQNVASAPPDAKHLLCKLHRHWSPGRVTL